MTLLDAKIKAREGNFKEVFEELIDYVESINAEGVSNDLDITDKNLELLSERVSNLETCLEENNDRIKNFSIDSLRL